MHHKSRIAASLIARNLGDRSSMGSYGTLVALLVCVICVSGSDVSQPNDGESFDYSNGPKGPSRWGDLKPAWSLCKRGVEQSPMTITLNNMVADPRLGKLDATYTRKPVASNISHDGHAVELTVRASAGTLKINNVEYRPVQMHFHMPSEHQILNHSFPLELHVVHFSKSGKIAVIAWLFNHGKASDFLAQFVDKLPSPKTPKVQTPIGGIKLPKLERSYGRYQGSLTTPPCSQKVTWTVMLWNFPTVSEDQLRKLKVAMPHANDRPSQTSHGRTFRMNTI